MQINKDDFKTIHTADRLYDGPEGQLLPGDEFRVIGSAAKNLIVVRLVDEDFVMSFRYKNGAIVSD